MEIVLLCARLMLAVVFGAAGIAKFADLEGSRRAMVGFGIPERLAGLLGWGLPAVELLIALALIPLSSAWLGAIAAGGLLLIFIVAIGANLARGRTPDCHCFGQLHSEPVGWSTLLRNVVLTAIAGFIVALGQDNAGLSALSWLNDLKTGEIVGLALGGVSVALLAVTFAYLRRVVNQHAVVLERIDAMKKVIDEDYAEAPVERAEAAAPAEGLPIGAPAPDFSLATMGGGQLTLDNLLGHGKSVLLLFISPNCVPCKRLLSAVNDWERDYRGELTIALLSKGDLKENRAMNEASEFTHLLLQGESGIAEEYRAQWTPAAVLINRDGRIASAITYGEEAISALVARAVTPVEVQRRRSLPINGNGHHPQITIGTPHALDRLGERAPSFSLPNLQGELVSSEELLGDYTLLLFWNPNCPHCHGMSEDIIRWEKDPPKGAPRLIIVSEGEADVVKAGSSKFSSQFLHDPEFKVGNLFGTSVTPSAVLIDREGKIASGPTAGSEKIMMLAGVRKSLAPVASSV